MIEPANLPKPQLRVSESDLVLAWRVRTLNMILFVVMIVGGIAALSSAYSMLSIGQIGLAALYLGATLIFALMALLPQLGYGVRVGFLLVIVYLIGVLDLFQLGVIGDGRILLMAVVIMATLLVSVRWVIVFGLASLIPLIWVSWLSVTGLLQPVRSFEATATSPTFLVSAFLIFSAASLTLSTAIAALVKSLGLSLHQAAQAAAQAEAARTEAEARAQALTVQTAVLLETEAQLREVVARLETPLVPLRAGMLLVPIVGTLDARRSSLISGRVLTAVHERQIDLVLIELSGVPQIDAAVAQALLQLAQALRLLGCDIALSGVSPQAAVALVDLGPDLRQVRVVQSPEALL